MHRELHRKTALLELEIDLDRELGYFILEGRGWGGGAGIRNQEGGKVKEKESKVHLFSFFSKFVCSARGLLLTLCSGISPRGNWENI